MMISKFLTHMRSSVTGNTVYGRASVFGVTTKVRGYLEKITRSAFDEVLKNPATDVRAVINHNETLLLGRQSSGTLRLDVDDEGLAFEVDLPDTSYARDLRELIERGDITGASFKFIPGADDWSRTPGGLQMRTHTSIDQLIDVSVVTYPAYDTAGVMLRSHDFRPPGRDQLIRARARVHLKGVKSED